MDFAKSFGTDKTAEEKGVRIDLTATSYVVVARIGNRRFKERYRELPQGVRMRLESGDLDEHNEGDLLTCEILADTILLDWGGFTENGKEVPYSKEAARDMLLKYPDFRSMIWRNADDRKTFAKKMEAESKNSKGVSSGS